MPELRQHERAEYPEEEQEQHGIETGTTCNLPMPIDILAFR
jgi:hypothetical protein